jgi:hypothetical protein
MILASVIGENHRRSAILRALGDSQIIHPDELF